MQVGVAGPMPNMAMPSTLSGARMHFLRVQDSSIHTTPEDRIHHPDARCREQRKTRERREVQLPEKGLIETETYLFARRWG